MTFKVLFIVTFLFFFNYLSARNSLSEFAYILKEGGLLYVVTDVKELQDWQVLIQFNLVSLI